MDLIRKIGAACLLWLGATGAFAQARECQLPDAVPQVRQVEPSAEDPRRVTPVTGYMLALSWSPEYCHGRRGADVGFQCGSQAHFGFILHGLWPDGAGKGQWPQYCAPAPILPPEVIRAQLCATPSAQLIQHEWAKHGTCAGQSPAAFFASGRALFQVLRFPDMNRLSRQRGLTFGAFADAFAKVNGLSPAMIRISANRRGWLEEVHLCLDRQRKPVVCGIAAGPAMAGRALKIARGG